jgi:hypothetical protein
MAEVVSLVGRRYRPTVRTGEKPPRCIAEDAEGLPNQYRASKGLTQPTIKTLPTW